MLLRDCPQCGQKVVPTLAGVCPACRNPIPGTATSTPEAIVAAEAEVVAAAMVSDPAATADTAPLNTAPLNTAPLDTAPLDTAPLDTAPLDTAPLEAELIDRPPPRERLIRVSGTALIVVAVLGLANSLYLLLGPERPPPKFADPEMQRAAELGHRAGNAAKSPLASFAYLVMVFGGAAMLIRRHWPLALAAALLAIVPCGSMACLTVPVGVVALVAISGQEVRASFH